MEEGIYGKAECGFSKKAKQEIRKVVMMFVYTQITKNSLSCSFRTIKPPL